MEITTETTTPAAFAPGVETGIPTPAPRPGWMPGTEVRVGDGESLARFLGWFSLGLGAAELMAPERLTKALGMKGREDLVRLYGVREIGTGLGILSRRHPTEWIWARIAGDLLDLATLGGALAGRNRKRDNVLAAIVAVAGVTALDAACARMLASEERH